MGLETLKMWGPRARSSSRVLMARSGKRHCGCHGREVGKRDSYVNVQFCRSSRGRPMQRNRALLSPADDFDVQRLEAVDAQGLHDSLLCPEPRRQMFDGIRLSFAVRPFTWMKELIG